MLTFQTPSTFDLRAVTIMGMNAKPETASPIGYIIGVLYEEYCHLAGGYRDESRQFQNHLCAKIGTLLVELARGGRGLRP